MTEKKGVIESLQPLTRNRIIISEGEKMKEQTQASQIRSANYEDWTQVDNAVFVETIRAEIWRHWQDFQNPERAWNQEFAAERIKTLNALLNTMILQDKKLESWAVLKGAALTSEEKLQLANTEFYTAEHPESKGVDTIQHSGDSIGDCERCHELAKEDYRLSNPNRKDQ